MTKDKILKINKKLDLKIAKLEDKLKELKEQRNYNACLEANIKIQSSVDLINNIDKF